MVIPVLYYWYTPSVLIGTILFIFHFEPRFSFLVKLCFPISAVARSNATTCSTWSCAWCVWPDHDLFCPPSIIVRVLFEPHYFQPGSGRPGHTFISFFFMLTCTIVYQVGIYLYMGSRRALYPCSSWRSRSDHSSCLSVLDSTQIEMRTYDALSRPAHFLLVYPLVP